MQEGLAKLTGQVYKALEFFPETDPLKIRAKEKALLIMENPAAKDIDLLLGYLEVARSQGWMNATNFLIISQEYKKIQELIKKPPEPKILPQAPKVEFKATERQKIILQFLQESKKAQVMDLQAVLPDITKRTIRRDLDELLDMGQIKRLGEFNTVFYQLP